MLFRSPLRRALAHPGCASGDLLPPDAPPAEQLAAALRALAGRIEGEDGPLFLEYLAP